MNREPRASLATVPICSWDAVYHVTCYQIVSLPTRASGFRFMEPYLGDHSGIHRNLALAVRTIVCSAASQKDATDGCAADQARLSSPHINPMLELEEAFHPRRVDIV